MIFVWLNLAVRWIIWLLVPPATNPYPPAISLRDPCPACGHRKSVLRTEQIHHEGGEGVFVKRICKTCGAYSFHKPVAEITMPNKPVVAAPPTPAPATTPAASAAAAAPAKG